RKVAQALEQLYGDAPETRAAELAHHFVAATKTADALKALTYCKLAGDQALDQIAPADALGWFAQATDLYTQVSPNEALHCDLLIGLGTAQRQTGDPAYRQTLLDAGAIAQALGDADRLVAAALANYRGTGGASTTGYVDEERVAALEAAVEAVGAADSSERARLLALLGTELMYAADLQRSSTLRSEALTMARRLDDPLCFLNVTALVHTDWSPQTLDVRLSDLDRAVALAESLGDPMAALHANRVRAIACLQAADRSGFDAHVETMAVLAERIEDPHVLWAAMIMQTQQALLAGVLDQARQRAEATWAVGATAAPEAAGLYATHLVELQRVQGRWVELAEAATLMAAHFSEFPGLSILRASLARVYCDLNRDDEARAVTQDDFADGFARFPDDMHWLSSMVILSEICVHLGHVDGAARLSSNLSQWHALVATAGAATTQGPVALHLGTLALLRGQHEEADGYFAEALDVSRRLESPYWIARTQIEQARLLRDANRGSEDAESLLASALDTARQHGFGAMIQQVELLNKG
ncbi:MAG TPA: tetratricopeptide repeat protein, partial [Acidimicrobiales bacterium]